MVYPQQWVKFVPRQDLYAMDGNKGRNYYSCGDFGYIIRNCKNQEIIRQGKRLEYGDNPKNIANLNGEESLVVLSQALVTTIG